MDDATIVTLLKLIAKKLGIDLGAMALPAVVVPWYRDISSPAPTTPLTDLNNEAEVKRYMAHGMRPNLKRGVAVSDWAMFLGLCDKIAAAGSPQEADAVIAGAGRFSPDVAILLILGGGTQGGGMIPMSIFAPWGSGFDMAAAAEWLVALPGEAGPSGR